MKFEQELIEMAINGLTSAYAPYSRFHVSAALLCEDGSVFTGANIENASYTPTICAERVALFKAVHAGKRHFKAIAICGGLNGSIKEYCPPCGVCRQVMREFCDPDQFKIILACTVQNYKIYTLRELLPLSFGPDVLQ